MAHPPELKERAQELRKQGLLVREVADLVGVPKATAIRWLNPEFEKRQREKSRKRRFSQGRRCPKCRRKMSDKSTFCQSCSWDASKVWTREKVIEAIQRWAIEKGAPPTYQDWVRAGPHHPSIWTIHSTYNSREPAFRSWSEALLAAGFEPRKRRKKMTPLDRERRVEMRRKTRERTLKRALEKENKNDEPGSV